MAVEGNLLNKSKKQLIEMIEQLSDENTVLKEFHSFMVATNERFVLLEKSLNKSLQYSRRDTIEISGIPLQVSHYKLEDEVIKIFEAAEVTVHGKKLNASKIHACHRIGKKGITICKFVNRKFAREGLVCGKNLRDVNLYGNNSKVYINDSFCPELKYLNYLIRKLKIDGQIFRWKTRNGINSVQVEEGVEFVEITHKQDLRDLNLNLKLIDPDVE